ncbi:MAG: bifunctional phosphoglucose/phosphomannose isomerase [Flavobacteriales bacterium]|jgi:glucose/mannose-6-phosphate isomerase
MIELIVNFKDQLNEAFEIAERNKFKALPNGIENIVICGLGGSGIGAKIVQDWVNQEINVPISLVNGYTLPNFVSSKTLVIGSSYSGNTEETVMALQEAKKKNAHIFCVSSGGQLASFCTEYALEISIIPPGLPPRGALGYSLVQLLNYLTQQGFISSKIWGELKGAITFLSTEQEKIKIKADELASYLYKKVGVLYAEDAYEGVVIRARQQFNENGKYLAWHHTIPEMNHNELVGWAGGDDRFAAVFFLAEDMHPRNKKRFEITKETVKEKTGRVCSLNAVGANFTERYMYFIHLVDWASYYLSELNKVDIMDIKVINHLKSELSKG